jgi:SAM-dependent methyltransferase
MQIRFFDPDTRPSSAKLEIIDRFGGERMAEMDEEGFRQFGYDYWDNPERTAGYGGYRYDGRYRGVAERFAAHYGLGPGSTVLEVGCGKGFLLVEFHRLGLEVAGVDLSSYAVENAHPDIRDRVQCASILDVGFEPASFNLVIAKDSLPHLSEEDVEKAVAVCERVGRNCFFEVEVARSAYEAEMLYRWDVTHQTRRPPEWWLDLFARVGYSGDHHFKVLVEDPNLPPNE